MQDFVCYLFNCYKWKINQVIKSSLNNAVFKTILDKFALYGSNIV